jgi:hypothetical protein
VQLTPSEFEKWTISEYVHSVCLIDERFGLSMATVD